MSLGVYGLLLLFVATLLLSAVRNWHFGASVSTFGALLAATLWLLLAALTALALAGTRDACSALEPTVYGLTPPAMQPFVRYEFVVVVFLGSVASVPFSLTAPKHKKNKKN